MQVTTVSFDPAYPQEDGQTSGDQAKPGDFDLAMAMVCALVSPAPVNLAQGALNPGDPKIALTGTGSFNLADPAVLLKGMEVAAPEKEPAADHMRSQLADIGDTSKAVADAVQPQAEDAILGNLLDNPAFQQSPQAPVKQPAVDGKALQPAPAPANMAAGQFQSPQAPVEQAGLDGKAFQPAAALDGQAVSTQFRMGTENTRGDSPVFSAALRPDPGAIPREVQPVQTTAGIEATPDPSLQQGVQITLENSPAVKTENKSKKAFQEVRLTGTSPLGAVLQGEKENESGTEKINAVSPDNGAGLIRAGEKTKTSDFPQGNNAKDSTTHVDVAQSNPPQPDPGTSTQSTGAAGRGVGLPDLKETLVQEIKHVFTNLKGDPQTHVQLKLEPEHLGQLTIRLFFNKGELNAHFYTGNSYVKDILEGSMQQLKDTLGRQDLMLNEALVFTGNEGSGGMGRYFHEKNGWGASPHNGYNHRAYGDPKAAPADLAPALADSSRVNYLI